MILNIDALELIPHRKPFMMIDKLIEFHDKFAATEFIIRHDNIFVNNKGMFEESGIIENVAQSCAARIGYISKYIQHEAEISLGIIGAVNNIIIVKLPVVNEKLFTAVNIIAEIGPMKKIESVVKIEDKIIAKCDMSLSLINKNDVRK